MAALKQIYEQILAQWAKMSGGLRAAVAAVGVLGLVGALLVATLGGQPKRILFSGLDPADTAAIVAALDSAKIDYELSGGGTTVHVNEGDVDRARIMMAEQ